MPKCDLLYLVRSALQAMRQSGERFPGQLGIRGEESVRRNRTVVGRSGAVTDKQDAASQESSASRRVARQGEDFHVRSRSGYHVPVREASGVSTARFSDGSGIRLDRIDLGIGKRPYPADVVAVSMGYEDMCHIPWVGASIPQCRADRSGIRVHPSVHQGEAPLVQSDQVRPDRYGAPSFGHDLDRAAAEHAPVFQGPGSEGENGEDGRGEDGNERRHEGRCEDSPFPES